MTTSSQSIRICLFNSREPFTELLREHGVDFLAYEPPMGVPMASGEWIEALGSMSFWGFLASVIIAFLKHRHSRKISITTKDNTVVNAENLTHEDLVKILRSAKDLTVIDTGPTEV